MPRLCNVCLGFPGGQSCSIRCFHASYKKVALKKKKKKKVKRWPGCSCAPPQGKPEARTNGRARRGGSHSTCPLGWAWGQSRHIWPPSPVGPIYSFAQRAASGKGGLHPPDVAGSTNSFTCVISNTGSSFSLGNQCTSRPGGTCHSWHPILPAFDPRRHFEGLQPRLERLFH